MATPLLQPRAALYAGTWFRSRLEATWAAYFEAHQIGWEYEQHAFEFPDGTRYMPDFWLPDSRAWFEAKGKMDAEDWWKIGNLVRHAGDRGELVILGGAPAGLVFGEINQVGELVLDASFARCAHCDSWTFAAAACRFCGFVDLERSTFIDACGPLSACRSRCRGAAFLWDQDGPVRDDPSQLHCRRWAQDWLRGVEQYVRIVGSKGVRF